MEHTQRAHIIGLHMMVSTLSPLPPRGRQAGFGNFEYRSEGRHNIPSRRPYKARSKVSHLRTHGHYTPLKLAPDDNGAVGLWVGTPQCKEGTFSDSYNQSYRYSSLLVVEGKHYCAAGQVL